MAKKWSRNFTPGSVEPFTISRSKVDMFTECQRCSYLDLRLGVKRPSMPSFTLNNAVDELFKREFDTHRVQGTAHPLMKRYGIDAVPLRDERMDEWRDALRHGIKFHHQPSNFILRGGIDDAWETLSGEIMVVDYKATSKKVGPSTEEDLYDAYKKQMEVYQWLFRRNGFKVHPTGYFVYANGKGDREAFDGKLEFDVELIPYTGSDAWVEPTLMRMRETLESNEIPPIGTSFGGGPCEHCTYREEAGKILQKIHKENKKK
ncbi:MAG: PD-(D/E)XK nuclease family protein [Minisyncoccia bacterium]